MSKTCETCGKEICDKLLPFDTNHEVYLKHMESFCHGDCLNPAEDRGISLVKTLIAASKEKPAESKKGLERAKEAVENLEVCDDGWNDKIGKDKVLQAIQRLIDGK